MADIVLLLDGEVCSDTLSQVEILAEGLSRHSDMKVRIVVLGGISWDSVLWRRRAALEWCGVKSGNRVRVFYLPGPRGAAAVDGINLGRCEALAGCTLLHCFSVSLLRTLGSLAAKKFLPEWCMSLSHWPGPEVVDQLRRVGRRQAVMVICQSKAVQKSLVEGGVPAKHCLVIQPEVPAEYKTEHRSAARRVLNLSDEVELILADPEISPWSKHRQLTWAGSIIGQFNRNLRVLVSGCGEQVERLQAFDDSLNPAGLGIYPGEKFGPEVLYGAADLLVLASTDALSPLPLVRAGRAHLAVVASNNSAFGEYLQHEDNALLFGVGPHNVGNSTCRRIRPLATAIVRLLEDRDLAQELGQQLAKDMREVFSGAKLLPAHLEVYGQILGQVKLFERQTPGNA